MSNRFARPRILIAALISAAALLSAAPPAAHAVDCNTNATDDAGEGLADANTNGAPDLCEPLSGGVCPGDMNTDGQVDGQDVQGVTNCINTGMSGTGVPCTRADIDNDGDNDAADLAAFVNILLNGIGVDGLDDDGDGVGSCADFCPFDPAKTAAGACGCGVSDADSDGDLTPDCLEACDNDPLKTDPGFCGCGNLETDTDGDTAPDCVDGCPMDPAKTAPGACGCGVPDTDGDGDLTPDCLDGCPADAAKIEPGACGCGVADTDTDGDLTPDCTDGCPADAAKIAPGVCGCGTPDADSDGDSVLDCLDGCPTDPFKTSPGICGCEVDDVDSDEDAVPNCVDDCPFDPAKTAPGLCGCGVPETDTDGDDLPDCLDNCPTVANTGQEDADTDGIGDVCEGLLAISCPPAIAVDTDNPDGIAVNYTLPTPTNGSGNYTVVGAPASGSVFPWNQTTTVTVTATDNGTLQQAVCQFAITVTGPTDANTNDTGSGNPIPDDNTNGQPPAGQTPDGDCTVDREVLRLLLTILFRAPICGQGCLMFLPLTLVGWAGMKRRRPRRRR